MKRIIEWLQKPIPIFDKIDLKRIFPGYFHVWIFRAAFILMAILLLVDLSLNDWSFKGYAIECPSDRTDGCWNPIYNCSIVPPVNQTCEGKDQFVFCDFDQTGVFPGHPNKCMENLPSWLCPDGVCNKIKLQPGERYGRQDFIAKFGVDIIMILMAAAFMINHMVYLYDKRKQ